MICGLLARWPSAAWPYFVACSVAGDDLYEPLSIEQQFPEDAEDGTKVTPPGDLKL